MTIGDDLNIQDIQSTLQKLEELRSVLGDDIVDEKISKLREKQALTVETAGGALITGDVDTAGGDFVGRDFIVKAISAGAEEWDSYVGGSLFGSYTVDFSATLDINGPDGKNEILFGYYPEEGVIGLTVVWGYFTGPPPTRKIIEFDILFNITYIWGDASLDPTIMDLQNIATHELGHGIGLADLYETTCSEETMYGYSIEGETNKRDLNYGDISGLQELYRKL